MLNHHIIHFTIKNPFVYTIINTHTHTHTFIHFCLSAQAHLETVAELERQKRERQEERVRAEKASANQRKALESIKEVVSDLEERKALETSILRKQLATSHAEVER